MIEESGFRRDGWHSAAGQWPEIQIPRGMEIASGFIGGLGAELSDFAGFELECSSVKRLQANSGRWLELQVSPGYHLPSAARECKRRPPKLVGDAVNVASHLE